jgi:hypothetical protein
MPGLGKDGTEALMDLSLERLKRNAFSIYADITVTSTFGNYSIAEDLAVPDTWYVEELAVFDSEHHFEGGDTADVAVDADQIHVAVIGEGGLEEYRISCHVCHLEE